MERGTFTVKAGHAEMLKGGVIMDVVTAEQAKIAENAGAVAVMALERVPADIRAAGGVARMADPTIVQSIVDATRHIRTVMGQIRKLHGMSPDELMAEAKELGAPYELVCEVARTGKLPVVNFAAGGVATPADAALMMQLGTEGVFVGSGIFKSEDPPARARAIVHATTNFNCPRAIAEASESLGEAMSGLDVSSLDEQSVLQRRGW